MKANRKLIFLIGVFIGILVQLWIYNIAKAENVVTLSYLPLSNASNGKTFTMTAQLKAKNNGTKPIYNVKATVYSFRNMSIDLNQIFLGDIGPNETKVGSESFTISFNTPTTQDPLSKEILWDVFYNDVNGNPVIEQISLK